MSESDTETDDTTEEGGASQDAPNESVQHAQSGSSTSVNDFVSEGEQVIIKEWALYVFGLFATFAVAIGLNQIIQEQWDHSLISFSGQAAGPMAAGLNGIVHIGNIYTIMVFGLFGSLATGIVLARTVDNTNNTAYKVGAATSILGLPLLLVLGTFMYTIQLDNWDPEFVNLLVSGLGAGIAAAVGSVLAIYLTEQQAPSALN